MSSGRERTARVRSLARAAFQPRLAMRGDSMRPLLHAPMVLELRGTEPPPRVGDVIAFEDHAERITAHRIVARRKDGYVTSGDAVPWAVEYVPFHRVVGVVAAVRADAAVDAARVDGRWHRLRGRSVAVFFPLRSALGRAKGRWRAFAPRTRPRPFEGLVAMLQAALSGDRAAALALARASSADRLVACAQREGCAGALGTLIGSAGDDDAASGSPDASRDAKAPGNSAVVAALRKARFAAEMQAIRYGEQVAQTVDVLSAAAVPFVLLKGAARCYAEQPLASAFTAVDIDVLIDAGDADRATAALERAGYHSAASRSMQARYRRRHHHLAPLVRVRGVSIELHTTLVPRGSTSLDLTFKALRARTREVHGAAGPACVLGDAAAAFHLALHGRGVPTLKDALLLALMLQRITPKDRNDIDALVASERIEALRLRATVALADRLAGIARVPDAAVDRYLSWVMRRHDLPPFARDRAQFADALLAVRCGNGRGSWREAIDVFPQGGSRAGGIARGIVRLSGRVVAGAATALYASRMPSD